MCGTYIKNDNRCLHPVRFELPLVYCCIFRFNGYCWLQAETHPRLDMDPDSSLLHIYAHVGRRRRASVWRRKRSDTQAEVSGSPCAILTLHRALILFVNFRSSLLIATPPRVWSVGWVGYVNSISEPTGSDSRWLSQEWLCFRRLFRQGYNYYNIRAVVLLVMISCHLVRWYQCFGETCCLCPQGNENGRSRSTKWYMNSKKSWLSLACTEVREMCVFVCVHVHHYVSCTLNAALSSWRLSWSTQWNPVRPRLTWIVFKD